MTKSQKDYVIPFAVHLNVAHLIDDRGKLKNRQAVLKELELLNSNYKKQDVSLKGMQELIDDLKKKDIEITIKGDSFVKVCVGRTRMTV